MDDPGSVAYYSQLNQNPGEPYWKGPPISAEDQAKYDKYMNIVQNYKPAGGAPLGPSGMPMSYVPADPDLQQFMSHDAQQHFGDVIDDPVYGKVQSTYRTHKQNFGDKYMPLIFGAALSAISGGAAAPFLAPMFSAATQYGSTGKINPKQLAMSLGGSMLGTSLLGGGLDPGIGQAIGYGKKAYDVYNAGKAATKGNFGPGVGMGLGAGYNYLTS